MTLANLHLHSNQTIGSKTETRNQKPETFIMDKHKAVNASAFLDDMFESEAEKKALAEYLLARRIVSKLAALRTAKGLTQTEIANAMGCKQARVSKLESGVDADLKMSDFEAYAKAIGSDVTILISDRGKSFAEQIKSHAFAIRNAFLKLVELAHKDDLIARGVADFHLQAFQNINAFLAETAEKLPVCAENRLPYIQIVSEDDSTDNCPPKAPETKTTRKRRTSDSAIV